MDTNTIAIIILISSFVIISTTSLSDCPNAYCLVID